MSDDAAIRDSWHLAAERAPFVFYEVDGADSRWAGGFAADGTHIEVIAKVHGDEVAVSTSLSNPRFGENMQQRAAMSELVWHNVMDSSEPVTLPNVITVETDDRIVRMGTGEHTIRGMRLAGDTQWVGLMQIDDVSLKIVTSTMAALSLRPCSDPSELPEFPPAG